MSLVVGGCASQIMQSYVGKSVAEPMLDYGAPAMAFDLDAETRAFVWTMQNSYTTPGYAYTTGRSYGSATAYSLDGYSATAHGSGIFNATTTIHPPQTNTWSCNYVLLAKRNGTGVDGPAAWTVVGFRPPSIMCE